MTAPTLTAQLDDIIQHWEEFGGPLLDMFAPAVERILGARVAVAVAIAVDQERAAWMTLVAKVGVACQQREERATFAEYLGWIPTADIRALLSAIDDATEAGA